MVIYLLYFVIIGRDVFTSRYLTDGFFKFTNRLSSITGYSLLSVNFILVLNKYKCICLTLRIVTLSIVFFLNLLLTPRLLMFLS